MAVRCCSVLQEELPGTYAGYVEGMGGFSDGPECAIGRHAEIPRTSPYTSLEEEIRMAVSWTNVPLQEVFQNMETSIVRQMTSVVVAVNDMQSMVV